jgi:hypothetical protein
VLWPTLSVRAVTVLDTTWRTEGGAKGCEWAGFGAYLRLGAVPQFRPVLALSTNGETWGEASGTWIGNDEHDAYMLTAAHLCRGAGQDKGAPGAIRLLSHLSADGIISSRIQAPSLPFSISTFE